MGSKQRSNGDGDVRETVAEYIRDYAHRMGTGQCAIASRLAEATVRTARAKWE
jgi:hypothetical protein